MGTENEKYDSDFKKSFEAQFTYIDGFMRNTRRYSKRPALHDIKTGVSYTYEELNKLVNQTANSFKKDGISNKNVVMYMLKNSTEFVLCYLATQKIGAVSCPINYNQASGEIALNIDDSAPDVFIYDSSFATTVREAMSMSSHAPKHVIAVNTTDSDSLTMEHDDFYEYINSSDTSEPVPDEPLNIYDETTRLYTSGTTGRPSGVSILSINEVLSAHDVIMGFGMTALDRTMNLTPWFHRGGLHSGGPCPTLYMGGELIVLRDVNPTSCLDYVSEFGITFLIGVPSIFNVLCHAQERQHADLSSLRGIVTMGSPLDRNMCIKLQEVLTPNVFNGYGTTETFWNTFLHPYDLPEMAGTAGQACTDDDVRIVRTYDDKHAEPDDLVEKDGEETGEIIIRSLSKTAPCYYNNPERTAKKYYKGFFYTGDLGTWDKESFITICGRRDDMIVTSGENVHAIQVEALINEYPKVMESCVVGVPDVMRGQAITAYIMASDPTLTIKELKSFVDSHRMLASYKRPRYYRIVEELPHTATGKLKHTDVRKMALKDLEEGNFK